MAYFGNPPLTLTTNTTLTNAQLNSVIFVNATAATSFTLPAPQITGFTYVKFFNKTNFNIAVSVPTANTLTAFNNTACSLVTFNTANSKIGATVEFFTDNNGAWVADPNPQCTVSIT